MVKICSKCNKTKDESQFYKAKGQKSGLYPSCKLCQKLYYTVHRKLPEVREHSRKHKRIWTKTPSGVAASRRYMLKKFGITLDYYDSLMVKQNNKCAICGDITEEYHLHVDHDHKTGKVRGLLCRHCNLLLGNAKDNISILQNSIDYLKGVCH